MWRINGNTEAPADFIFCDSMCIPFFDVVVLLKLKLLGEQVVSSITSEQRASASTARAAWVIVKSATHGLMETAHLVGAEKSEILAH